MRSFTTHKMCEIASAELICDAERAVSDFVIDSRKAGEGSCFVAFVGENVDGNNFASAALEAGAACVVLSRTPEPELIELAQDKGAALLRAADDDAEGFLLALAASIRDAHPEWLVIGITGSNGKTTTKDFVRAALEGKYRVHATKGNLNSTIGLPFTIFEAPEDTEVLILEMGMNHVGEIKRMSLCARPNLACITNIGTSHIGLLGSRGAIAEAKAEIIAGMEAHDEQAPTLVLTSADDMSEFIETRFAEPAGVLCCRVGHSEDALFAKQLDFDAAGCAHALMGFADGFEAALSLKIPGKAAFIDAMIALELAELAGQDRQDVIAALEAMEAPEMRMDVLQSSSELLVVDDSYNASPSSMAAALDVLESFVCSGKRVAILGEMGELGDEASRLHALVGAYAAAKDLDLLVCVGEKFAPAYVEAACIVGMDASRILSIEKVEDIYPRVKNLLGAGDVVLVKASRAAGLDRVAKELSRS